jgi:dsRNA-specific ribonuclease
MSKTRKLNPNYKKWEATGDAIIKLTVAENIPNLPRSIEGISTLGYLESNKNLSKIRPSLKIRFKGRHPNDLNAESMGDEVECYIAFLYFNYGLDCAKRFVYNKILAKHIIL